MVKSRPIVLLTDFGTKDSYVGSIKGVILTLFPKATIADLTHEVEPQDVRQAAFLLEWTYPFFPRGSVFVCVVDPGVGSHRRILAAKTRHGIFLAPDNGLLSRVLDQEKAYEARVVTNRSFFAENISATFHGRDCFAPTAARLAKNPGLFSRLGPKITDFVRLPDAKPKKFPGKLCGEIFLFDHFGNAFLNVPRSMLTKNPHRVVVKGRDLGPIRRSYYEVKKGKAVAVFNSMNLLEIAVNQGSARDKLKLKTGDRVEIIEE